MARELRPYQREAADAVAEEWAAGNTATAVVLPTGTGKTDVIADLGTRHARDGGWVLALAHRDELLNQITERFGMHGATRVGRIQAARTERQHRLTVASTPTMAARVAKLAEATGAAERRRAEHRLPRRPSLVLYDECHHAPSPSSMAVLEWAGVLDGTCPAAGFTATLVRGDKRGLGDVWQSVAFKRDIKWAIDEGFLVRPRGRVVVAEHMDLNAAKVTAGDYQDNQLGEMVSQDADQIVKAWREHAIVGADRDGTAPSHRRTIVFAPTVAAAQVLADEFTAQGVDAECVFGSTAHAERNRIYGDLAAGRITVLCSVMVTTEGWDCPPVECVLMARPTKLPGLYQQCIGRALRPSPATGKTDCLVLDVVGASRTQRLTTLIDLSPTAEYDTSEIDALPCEVCGYPTRQTFVGELTCVCPPEAGERDPDGGRRRLVGPARYEDLDLLMQESGCVWLQTYGGTAMLPAGDRTAILWHDKGTDLYRAGHMANGGTLDGQWLTETSEGLTAALQRAEAWATTHAPSISSRSASWRRPGRASEMQLAKAAKLGIPGAEQMTKARLSDEISIAITSRRLGR